MHTDADTDVAVSYQPSLYFRHFSEDINEIKNNVSDADYFHLKLYLANIISAMERYLYDLYITEISTNKNTFLKMCSSAKFAGLRYSLPVILYQDIPKIIISSIKNKVWHRVNDIDHLFMTAMNIPLILPDKLSELIETRHHVIHRNGYDFDGNPVLLTTACVRDAVKLTEDFIHDIDKKYHRYMADNHSRRM